MSGNDFWTLGTGTGIAQPIPKFWEREREWKIAFPTFGNGNGNDKFHSQFLGTGTGMTNSIPDFREREWDVVIPGNDREREREWRQKIGSNFIFCRKNFISHFFSQTYQNCIVNFYKCDKLRNIDLFKYIINKRNAENNPKNKNRRFFGHEYALIYDECCYRMSCIAHSCGSSELKELLSELSRKFRGVSCPEFG